MKFNYIICSTLDKTALASYLDSMIEVHSFELIPLYNIPEALVSERATHSVSYLNLPKHIDTETIKEQLSADIFLLEGLEKLPVVSAFFDMDSTLIDMEVIVALAEYAGTATEVSEITESAMRGELDFTQSLRKRVSTLKGLSSELIEEIKSNLPLNPGLQVLAHFLNEHDIETTILSGGFKPFSEHLKEILHFHESIANELELDAKGAITGALLGDIVDAELKKKIVIDRMRKRNQIKKGAHIVVGDGANDLEMMSTTTLSVGFKAKPAVKKEARFTIEQTGHDALIYLLMHLNNQLKQ